MKHLEAGFITWLITLILAIIIFIFEWLANFKEFLMFKYFWITFCKQNKLLKELKRLAVKYHEDEKTDEVVVEKKEWELEMIWRLIPRRLEKVEYSLYMSKSNLHQTIDFKFALHIKFPFLFFI